MGTNDALFVNDVVWATSMFFSFIYLFLFNDLHLVLSTTTMTNKGRRCVTMKTACHDGGPGGTMICPNDVVHVVWATSMFFSFIYLFLMTYMYYCLVLSTTTLTNKGRRRVTVAITMKTTRHDGGPGDAQTMSFTSFGLLVCFFFLLFIYLFLMTFTSSMMNKGRRRTTMNTMCHDGRPRRYDDMPKQCERSRLG
jgi:hypothetical protein